MEKNIFAKISEIKEIILKRIKTFEDFNSNKNIVIGSIEEIEKMLKEIFHINIEENNTSSKNESKENNINNKQREEKEIQRITQDNNINKNTEKNDLSQEDNEQKKINPNEKKIEIKEGDIVKDKQKNENQNNIDIKEEINNDNDDINNNKIDNDMEQNDENQNLEMQEEEEEDNNNDNEKYTLPKLNFDYDKNINELLNDININQEKPFIKASLDDDKSNDLNYNINDELSKNKNSSINNDTIKNIFKKKEEHRNNQQSPINYLKKNKVDSNMPFDMKEINNEEENDNMSNIKISNLQRNGYSELFSFNQDLININNKSSFNPDELPDNINDNLNNKKEEEPLNINNKKNNIDNNIQREMNNKQNDGFMPYNQEYDNEKNTKNSKALRVADIIMKINSNDILFDIITQIYSKDILNQLMSPNVDINLIDVIEQTIDKITILENEEIQKLRNKESFQGDINNVNNNSIHNNDNNIYCKNEEIFDNTSNLNNRKSNIPKMYDDYIKNRTSNSFYDKSNSSYYSQLPPKVSQKKQSNKYKAEYLNSEILQNYPKTGKTILGYEQYKKDRSKEFNFERSLRNDKYMNDYRKMKSYNFNNSKADSLIKNQSYHSNNRSFSNKKAIFNNYTSPFGDYFDSSLQKGGQSKLKMDYLKNNYKLFKDCRSPVKDYIDGINDVYL